MVDYTATINNVHIFDSYAVPKKRYDRELSRIHIFNPECEVFAQRSMRSLKSEWATHSFLYDVGLWKSRTKDVDLNVPMAWYKEWAYFIVGALVWIFIP